MFLCFVLAVAGVLSAAVEEFVIPPWKGHVHASSLLPLKDGGYLAVWFQGSREGASDVGIAMSRRVKGAWEPSRVVAKVADVAHWNPVLRRADDGRIELYFKVGAKIADWKTWTRESRDEGATWGEPRELVPGDATGGRGPVKNKCLRLADGGLLAPGSVERGPWRAFVDRSDDDGRTWRRADLPVPAEMGKKGVIQPSLWQSADGAVHALMRSNTGVLWRSDSTDGGRTWTEIRPTDIPNNNSGIDLVRASDGVLYLARNASGRDWGPRTCLELWASADDGATWRKARTLAQAAKGEFSYPAVVEARPGVLALTFTWLRSQVRFVELALDELDEPLAEAAVPVEDPAAWKLTNYEGKLRFEQGRVFGGAPCLYVGGSTSKCDTAWYATSTNLPLVPGAKSFRIRFKAYSERRVFDTTVAKVGWNNSVFWKDARGRDLKVESLTHSYPRGDFSEIRVSGPIPEGAARVVFQLGFDEPNIGPGGAFALRDFTFAQYAAPRAGQFVAEDVVPLPPREIPKRTYAVDRMPDTPRCTLRDDGVCLVDGTPFFPIGAYAVCRREFNGMDLDRAFADLKKAGFNFAHTYGDSYDPAFLAAARKHGFKLWVQARWPDRNLLEVGRFDPSILAWYLGDDTADHQTPEETRGYHDAVKSVDPTRLTCQADPIKSAGRVTRYSDFVTATDVFMPEIYPVRGKKGDPTDATCVAVAIRDMQAFRRDVQTYGDGQPRACWPIVQYFKGWGGWGHFPTRDQAFAMTFATLIHGAHGITWYTYGGFFDKKRNDTNEGMTSTPERWKDMSELATWIGELAPALVARACPQPPPAEILQGPAKDPLGRGPSVTLLLKRTGDAAYLLTVNACPESVRARFRLPDLPAPATATVMHENRTVTLQDGLLEDDFAPFAVHVYKFPR